MNLYIVSSIFHFKQFVRRGKNNISDNELMNYVFVTRDWFVEKEIRGAGYDAIILENHLDKNEVEKLTWQETNELTTWFIDDAGDDFSLYRSVSLADSAIQHFCNGVFSKIFNFVPNVLKLINIYKPKKIIYEYHVMYRKCIYFDNEDALLKLICDKHGIELECIYTDSFDEIDEERYKQSPVLQRNKDCLVNSLSVRNIKNVILNLYNYFQIKKHQLKQKFGRKKVCIFTDNTRGTSDFKRYCEKDKDYLFIVGNRPESLLRDTGTSILLKSGGKIKHQELDNIRNKWKNYVRTKSKERLVYFDIDLTSYIDLEVNWAINNVFPKLINLIDKVINYFSRVRIDLILTQADSTIDYRYIFNIARKMNIKNYIHPDGPRFIIMIGARHAENILLYSTSTLNDYKVSGVKSNMFVVGNPPFQKLFKSSLNTRNASSPGKKKRILVGAKNEGPWILGNYLSSSIQFLEDILKGIYPVRDHFEVTVRNNPNQSNFLNLLKDRYFEEYDFEIQEAGKVPFLEAVHDFDIFILKWTTIVYEAAILGKLVIFYSDNNLFLYPPFDSKSELTTARSPDELTTILKNILNDNFNDYLKFNKQDVLEKYVGPLDMPLSVGLLKNAISIN